MTFEYAIGLVLSVLLSGYLVYALIRPERFWEVAMTANGWTQIGLFFLVIIALTKPLGTYMFRVFEGERAAAAARARAAGARAVPRSAASTREREQTWKSTRPRCSPSALLGMLVTYAIQRLQHVLPLNPQGLRPASRRPGLQHRRQLHDQHQLAGVRAARRR